MDLGTKTIDDVLALPAIGMARDERTLGFCLRLALMNIPGKGFRHLAPLRGLDRSVRIFGQAPFDGSVELPRIFPPEELAAELMRLARTEARYPTRDEPPSFTLPFKGWTIFMLDDDKDAEGNPLTLACATWMH